MNGRSTIAACLMLVLIGTLSQGAEPRAVMTLDKVNWLIGTWTGETDLSPDRPDLGPAGTPMKIEVTWRQDLDGKLLVGETKLQIGEKVWKDAIVLVMRDPVENVLKLWDFTLLGMVLHGSVLSDDPEKSVTWIGEGSSPTGEKVSGRLVYTRKGKDEIASQFRDVKIGETIMEEGPVVILKRRKE